MVKVLFDQGTPVGLRRHLDGHHIETVNQRGWSEKKNGELLDLAEEAGYERLVTVDRNMQHQQNLTGRRIGIVVLVNAKWPEVAKHTRKIEDAIRRTGPGEAREVRCGKQDDSKNEQVGANRRKHRDRGGRDR